MFVLRLSHTVVLAIAVIAAAAAGDAATTVIFLLFSFSPFWLAMSARLLVVLGIVNFVFTHTARPTTEFTKHSRRVLTTAATCAGEMP